MNEQEENVVEFQGRLIAFLDVLGFSNQLESRDAHDLHRQYSELIDRAQKHLFDDKSTGVRGNFARAQFLFDSVVLVSHQTNGNERTRNTYNFLAGISLLQEWSLESCLPLRGAIGLGDLLEDRSRNILLSSVVPSLLKEERQQEWAGVSLLPDASDVALRNLYGPNVFPAMEGSGVILKYGVPVKNDGVVERWCLNWVHMCDLPDLAPGIRYLVEPKRANTEAFIRHVEGLPKFEVPLPARYRPIAKVRLMAALRDGGVEMLSVKFIGEDGRGVDHPGGFAFQFDGQKISITIDEEKLANVALQTDGASRRR